PARSPARAPSLYDANPPILRGETFDEPSPTPPLDLDAARRPRPPGGSPGGAATDALGRPRLEGWTVQRRLHGHAERDRQPGRIEAVVHAGRRGAAGPGGRPRDRPGRHVLGG